MVIRAELLGSSGCRAEGLSVRGSSPVLALCRQLVAAGYDPASRLEAYRGDVLCLMVRSIGEAAGLEVSGAGTGFIRSPDRRIARAAAQNGKKVSASHPTAGDAMGRPDAALPDEAAA